ncbi:MAG: MBL fold metallo-hydrolase [Rhodocyclaceae bacterium]|nr:MBL fold metallo-hydrolase [Rhodocyclaceae bacterium]
MERWNDYKNGIYAFCANYLRPHLAAVHLVLEKGRVAFVDTGTNESLSFALDALKHLGLGPEAVDYVILTHIHLDHAGGAGAFMQAFPNARLVVHPRGSRHMASPAKLVQAVIAVYGADYVERVYGQILPVPQERILETSDGMVLDLAGRELLCLDTPGHAKHHIAIVDRRTRGIFTGDTFGISYREMDTDGRQFIFPTTTPSQFDPADLFASMERLMAQEPRAMYLTHYSQVLDVPRKNQELLRLLRAFCAITLAHKDFGPAGKARTESIRQGLARLLLDESRAFGCTLPDEELLGIWGQDLELDAQGLDIWLESGAPGAP